MKTTRLISVLCIVVAGILASYMLSGCGGGKSAGVSVAGAVSDVEGNLIPNATVTMSGTNGRVTTSYNGAYTLRAGDSGWQTVTATATIGESDKLGAIAGVVRDSGGLPIDGVRVFVSTTYGSSFNLTGADGRYRIDDLPASVKVSGVDTTTNYTMTASKLGFSNETRSQDDGGSPINVTPGGVTTIDFVITATSGSPVSIPNPFDISAIAWTFPKDVSRSPSAYNAIRAYVSPLVKRMLTSKTATTTRAARAGSMIEIDISWYTSWIDFLNAQFGGNPPNNLAGFAVYRRVSSEPTSDADRIYFDRQPLLTDFFDMSPELTDGSTYFYRITAINTTYLDSNGNFNPASESAFSSAASATPLDQLSENGPQNNSSVNRGSVVFS
jgi:hypothetical protein